jgi:hypothetical protein
MVMDVGQPHAKQASQAGIFARLARTVQQFVCGLHGHDALLHFEDGRMSLQCSSCGYESPGWDVNPTEARPARVVDPAPRLVQMPLVRQRRVA